MVGEWYNIELSYYKTKQPIVIHIERLPNNIIQTATHGSLLKVNL